MSRKGQHIEEALKEFVINLITANSIQLKGRMTSFSELTKINLLMKCVLWLELFALRKII